MPPVFLASWLAAPQGPLVCLAVFLGFLVFMLALLGISGQHSRLAGLGEKVRRLARGQQFLCPNCLRFAAFHYACGVCGEDLEDFVVHTRGLYLNDCPHCGQTVYSTWLSNGHPPLARCEWCRHASPRLHHQRRVRVLGVLRRADLDALGDAAGAPQPESRETRFRCHDDGKCLTYLLDLTQPPVAEDGSGQEYAARRVEGIWIGEDFPALLALGEALDQGIRHAGLADARRRALPVSVSAETLDPQARSLLESRFGTIRAGIPAGEFLSDGVRKELDAGAAN
jgi:hypothetical protein